MVIFHSYVSLPEGISLMAFTPSESMGPRFWATAVQGRHSFHCQEIWCSDCLMRGSMLLDTLRKMYHALIRAHLLSWAQTNRIPTQFGGFRGQQPAIASLLRALAWPELPMVPAGGCSAAEGFFRTGKSQLVPFASLLKGSKRCNQWLSQWLAAKLIW